METYVDYGTVEILRIWQHDPIRSRIEDFANVPLGWEYGDGGSAPKHVIATALEIYDYGTALLLGVDPFLSGSGYVTLAFYDKDNECVDITIFKDGSIEIDSKLASFGSKEDALIPDVKDILRRLASLDQWNLPDYFTQNTIILGSDAFRVHVSQTPQKIKPSLWSTSHVSARGLVHPEYAAI